MSKSINENPVWHTLAAAAAAQKLESDLDRGLASDEAARRLDREGPNEIRERGRRSVFNMAVSQFTDFMILVLIAAAFVSGFIGDAEDTFVILAIVLLNAAIGFAQDYRAERAMAALKSLAALKATVVRGGRRHVIAAAGIVPGDIVLLEAGNAVPADLRLIEAPRLKINEAALTGEAVPVEKQAAVLSNIALPLADQSNMAFKGTVVTYGRARGIAIATGMATHLGKIAGLLEAVPTTQTPLQRRLARFRTTAGAGDTGRLRHHLCDRHMARRTDAAHAAHRLEPCRRSHSRGVASRGHRDVGLGRPHDGTPPCLGAASARS